MDLQRAIAFIEARGSAVEKARLRYLLTSERPAPDQAAALLASQREDGGWPPFWNPGYSSLDATCFRLAQAEPMGIASAEPAIRNALHFLVKRQRADGSWEEDETAASAAPPWAKPGDLAARLYLTSNCGFWAASLGELFDPAMRAAQYLQTYLDEEGKLPSFFHAHWLAAGLWLRLNQESPASRVLNYLEQRLAELETSNLAWMVITLRAGGLPASATVVVKAVQRLEQRQQADGRWPSEDGPEQDVHSTLEALRVLRLISRSPA